MEEQFIVGQIVRYTYQEIDVGAEYEGKVRPAIVVDVHKDQYMAETGRTETGYDLRVFPGAEGVARVVQTYFVYGCRRDSEGRPGTCRNLFDGGSLS
jgi:hypothetical protein